MFSVNSSVPTVTVNVPSLSITLSSRASSTTTSMLVNPTVSFTTFTIVVVGRLLTVYSVELFTALTTSLPS